MVDALSQWKKYGNQQNTDNSIYVIETMSELFDINELLEGMLPINLI